MKKRKINYIMIIIKSIKVLWKCGAIYLIYALLVSIIGGVLPSCEVYLFKLIVDKITNIKDNINLNILTLLGLFGSLKLIRMTLDTIGQSAQRILSESAENFMRIQVYKKSLSEPYSVYDSSKHYDLIRKVSTEAHSRPIDLVNSLFFMLEYLISLIGVFSVVFVINHWIALILIVAMIPYAITRYIFEQKLWGHRWSYTESLRQLDYLGDLMTSREAAGEIRMHDLKNFLLNKYNTVWKSFYNRYKSIINKYSLKTIFVIIPAGFILSLSYYIIYLSISLKKLLLGDISLILTAIDRLYDSTFSFLAFFNQVMENTMFLNDYYIYTEASKDIQNYQSKIKIDDLNLMNITFDNVSFKYPGKEDWAIKNISFEISPYSKIALVGENGSGKTTILKLISGLYKPTEGRILLGNIKLEEYSQDDLRKYIGILFQDFVKYQFTVLENIQLSTKIDKQKINNVIQYVDAQDFINELPNGINTSLGRMFSDGVELSGGQWQKIAIARELYKDSKIILLDEPSSSLDPKAEDELFEYLGKLLHNRTAIFTTHRFGMLKWADKIIVMKNGNLVEEGTHADLIRKQGVYFELFNLQAERFNQNKIIK